MIRRNLSQDVSNVEINLAPLIDMMFLLLIFFIVTTVFVQETGIELSKPRASSSVELAKESLVISVTDNGRIYYGSEEIGMNSIRGLVARSLRARPDIPVIIAAGQEARTRTVVKAIDECRLAGAESVSLATDREEN